MEITEDLIFHTVLEAISATALPFPPQPVGGKIPEELFFRRQLSSRADTLRKAKRALDCAFDLGVVTETDKIKLSAALNAAFTLWRNSLSAEQQKETRLLGGL